MNISQNNFKMKTTDQYQQDEAFIDRFVESYNALHSGNLETISEIYNDDIQFIDPVHNLNGIDEVKSYFSGLYENLQSIKFIKKDLILEKNKAALFWEMELSHKKLNSGEIILLHGMSKLHFNDKVYFHQDYFDMGEMVYQNIPILKSVINMIRKKF